MWEHFQQQLSEKTFSNSNLCENTSATVIYLRTPSATLLYVRTPSATVIHVKTPSATVMYVKLIHFYYWSCNVRETVQGQSHCALFAWLQDFSTVWCTHFPMSGTPSATIIYVKTPSVTVIYVIPIHFCYWSCNVKETVQGQSHCALFAWLQDFSTVWCTHFPMSGTPSATVIYVIHVITGPAMSRTLYKVKVMSFMCQTAELW